MDSPARMPGLARFALPAALALATGCTIVHHGAPGSAENASAQKAAANEAFDAKAFVEGGWAGKIEPELVRDAVDVREVVAALKKEQEAAERKYGRRQDETALFNFIVKGRETIKAVNTESAAGYAEYEDCLANARANGHVFEPAQPRSNSGARHYFYAS